MKLIAVLKDRSSATADCPAGLNGSTACSRITRIDDEEAADMEQQHGDRIGQPMLLALLVDAADPVDPGLDRPQHRRQEGALAVEDARHVPAERLGQRDDDGAVQNDLNPADGGHGRMP